MIKRVSLLILVILLLLVSLSLGRAQASSGLTVLKSSAEADFPASLNFSLSAESDTDITDIRLHYLVERMVHAEVVSEVYIDFEPAPVVEVEWAWDMRKTGGLPPGSSVQYWWTVADADGNKVQTEPVKARVDDHRYAWNDLTQGKVTLYWYEGDDSFARELMAAAQQALVRLTQSTNVELERPVKIYIYANAQDLKGSMIFPQEWTGGVAFTRYGIVAIGIVPTNIDWGSRVIAHELTHLVIHQMTFSPYGGLPTWLDEGLAMNAEGELGAVFATLLGKAVDKGNLISVRSLSSPFSAFAEESSLAYAQSYSLVEFLSNSYGQQKMFELLCTFKEGSGYDEALVRVYGFDMDGLDGLWRDYLNAQTIAVRPAPKAPLHVWVLSMFIVGLILATIIIPWLWYFDRLGARDS